MKHEDLGFPVGSGGTVQGVTWSPARLESYHTWQRGVAAPCPHPGTDNLTSRPSPTTEQLCELQPV